MPDDEMMAVLQAEWERWLKTRPANVRKTIVKFFPRYPRCVRIINDRGHYALVKFDECENGAITAMVLHGADSLLPGFAVFGVELPAIVPCDCGKWESASDEQTEQSVARVHSIAHDCDDPNCMVHKKPGGESGAGGSS